MSVFFILMFKSHYFKQWQGVFATMTQIENIKTTKTTWNGGVMRGEFFEKGCLFMDPYVTCVWNST